MITVNYRVTRILVSTVRLACSAEKTFAITVKGANDDPVVDLNVV